MSSILNKMKTVWKWLFGLDPCKTCYQSMYCCDYICLEKTVEVEA